MKKILYQEYSKYLDDFKNQIVDILILEGKQTRGRQVRGNELEFIDFITTNNYFLTTFDLWLLVQKFEIPCIFISSTKLLETNKKSKFFIGYGDKNDDFAFLIIPGIKSDIKSENIPSFKLIESNTNDIFIPLNNLLNCENKNNIIDSFKNKITIEEFVREFNPSILKKKLRIEEDSDEEEPVKIPKKIPKKKVIIESTSSVIEDNNSSQGSTNQNGKTKKTKKTKLVGIKPKTKKNK